MRLSPARTIRILTTTDPKILCFHPSIRSARPAAHAFVTSGRDLLLSGTINLHAPISRPASTRTGCLRRASARLLVRPMLPEARKRTTSWPTSSSNTSANRLILNRLMPIKTIIEPSASRASSPPLDTRAQRELYCALLTTLFLLHPTTCSSIAHRLRHRRMSTHQWAGIMEAMELRGAQLRSLQALCPDITGYTHVLPTHRAARRAPALQRHVQGGDVVPTTPTSIPPRQRGDHGREAVDLVYPEARSPRPSCPSKATWMSPRLRR